MAKKKNGGEVVKLVTKNSSGKRRRDRRENMGKMLQLFKPQPDNIQKTKKQKSKTRLDEEMEILSRLYKQNIVEIAYDESDPKRTKVLAVSSCLLGAIEYIYQQAKLDENQIKRLRAAIDKTIVFLSTAHLREEDAIQRDYNSVAMRITRIGREVLTGWDIDTEYEEALETTYDLTAECIDNQRIMIEVSEKIQELHEVPAKQKMQAAKEIMALINQFTIEEYKESFLGQLRKEMEATVESET